MTESPLTLPLPIVEERAELAVIGCAMVNPLCVAEMRELLPRPEQFYSEPNRVIWRAVIDLDEAGILPDAVSVAARLGAKLDLVGGYAYLAGTVADVESTVYASNYAAIVARASYRRELQNASMRMARLAQDCEPGADLYTQAIELVTNLAPAKHATAVRLGEFTGELLADLDAAADGRRAEGSVPFGLSDIDRIVRPMERATLSVLAARPGIGKSALALQVALATATEGVPVLVLSLEMRGKLLLRRAVSMTGRVEFPRQPRESDIQHIARLAEQVGKLPLFIVDDNSGTVVGLRAAIRDAEARNRLTFGLVIVDYLQLLEAPARGDNRQNEVAGISRSLLRLARELNVPILALSQLNRASEGREDTRPRLSDLRESGQIEQDAALVVGLWRERDDPDAPGRATIPAEAIVLKQRDGGTGTARVLWSPRFVSFQMEARV